jgi:hypothetical protein
MGCDYVVLVENGRVVFVQAIKACRGSGSPSRPHQFNSANYARFHLTGRLCWPYIRSGFFAEECLICLLEIESQWPGICFGWSGNHIEWWLLTVIKIVFYLYMWWLSRQVTTVSERLGHTTGNLLPSRVFFVTNTNLKAWPWWSDFFSAPVCVNKISLSVMMWFLNLCREPSILFLSHVTLEE